MIVFSNTHLGKLCAIALIIFYTIVDLKYGFMFCVLMIFYYQMDAVEGMAVMTKKFRKLNTEGDEWDIFDWMEDPHSTPIEDSILYSNETVNTSMENFSNVDDDTEEPMFLYKDNDTDTTVHPTEIEQEFRQENCKNGQLMFKGNPVKTDMADMVFEELEFLNERCNPCDETCRFSIMEQKLKSQEEITYPKPSDNWVNDIWQTWFNGNYQRPYAPVTTRPPPYSPVN
jgi:hypothetical protein